MAHDTNDARVGLSSCQSRAVLWLAVVKATKPLFEALKDGQAKVVVYIIRHRHNSPKHGKTLSQPPCSAIAVSVAVHQPIRCLHGCLQL